MTQTGDKFAAHTASEIDDADIEKDRAAVGVRNSVCAAPCAARPVSAVTSHPKTQGGSAI